MTREVKIDYISFTVPIWKKEKYLEYLGAETIWLDRGFRGYRDGAMLSQGGMFGMSLGRDDCYFDLPGKALGVYLHSYEKYIGLLKTIIEDGGNICRIDSAYDIKGELGFEKVVKAVRSGMLVSKSRNVRIIEKVENLKDGLRSQGGTVYVGSGKSDKMCRIYDKAKEQGQEGDWVRFEMQLRNEVARKFVEGCINKSESEFPEYVVGTMAGFIDFRKVDNDNISRRTQVSWFKRLVSGVEKIKFVFDVIEKNINEVVKWVERQVGPSLAVMKRYFGKGFDSVLDHILYDGDDRLREKHFRLLGVVC